MGRRGEAEEGGMERMGRRGWEGEGGKERKEEGGRKEEEELHLPVNCLGLAVKKKKKKTFSAITV